MNTVEPIRDKEVVLDIADYLRYRNQRDYVMFMFGIYSGLRICDILQFRVRDVRGKDYIARREKKTGKEKRFPINKNLRKIGSSPGISRSPPSPNRTTALFPLTRQTGV